MKEQVQTDFDKIAKTSGFSEREIKLKKVYLNLKLKKEHTKVYF